MCEECKGEGDEQEDADAEGLVLEEGGETVNAVVQGRAVNEGLEVVEKARVADTTTLEGTFKITRKLLEVGIYSSNLASVGRVLDNGLSLKIRDVLIAR
jgi:hypothetical protein